jgi:hypothetical protein
LDLAVVYLFLFHYRVPISDAPLVLALGRIT